MKGFELIVAHVISIHESYVESINLIHEEKSKLKQFKSEKFRKRFQESKALQRSQIEEYYRNELRFLFSCEFGEKVE